MRILINSPMKSGNHLLKAMIGKYFDLAQHDFNSRVPPGSTSYLPQNSIAHSHLLLNESHLKRFQSEGVAIVSIIRHPARILASILRHVKIYSELRTFENSWTFNMLDDDVNISNVENYVWSYSFYRNLYIAKRSLELGIPIISYEDLISDPMKKLPELIVKFDALISQRRLLKAVCATERAVLRASRFTGKLEHIGLSQSESEISGLEDLLSRVYCDPVYRNVYDLFDYDQSFPFVKEFSRAELWPFFDKKELPNGIDITPLIKAVYWDYYYSEESPHNENELNDFCDWIVGRSSLSEHITNFACCALMFRGDLRNDLKRFSRREMLDYFRWLRLYGRVEFDVPEELLFYARTST